MRQRVRLLAPTISVLACAVLLVDCGHTSDAKLEALFHNHETEFNQLMLMAKSETRILTITPRLVVTETSTEEGWEGAERQGLARDKWNQYQELFESLGLHGGMLRGGKTISFETDTASLWNGDSEKGFLYSENASLTPTVSDLGRVRASEEYRDPHGGFTAYKLLQPHWYLFIHFD